MNLSRRSLPPARRTVRLGVSKTRVMGWCLVLGMILFRGPWTCRAGEARLVAKDGGVMVYVPAGEFLMGDGEGHQAHSGSQPRQVVRLDAYLIDRDEVTNRQYQEFLEWVKVHSDRSVRHPQQPPGKDHTPRYWKRFRPPLLVATGMAALQWFREEDFRDPEGPVVGVDWFDACAYAAWAGKRLPTEAQWERAARGSGGLRYPWGMEWKDGVAACGRTVDAGPEEVGSHPEGASPAGCLDMGGNVWEWVADWYDRYYYASLAAAGTVHEPRGPADGAPPEERFVKSGTAAGNERSTRKVIRGGGWVRNGRENLRTSKRMWGNPAYWFNDTGFRCAVTLEPTQGAGGSP